MWGQFNVEPPPQLPFTDSLQSKSQPGLSGPSSTSPHPLEDHSHRGGESAFIKRITGNSVPLVVVRLSSCHHLGVFRLERSKAGP